MRNAVYLFFFRPKAETGLNRGDFQKAENRTGKVFVEHKNSKPPSKQVHSPLPLFLWETEAAALLQMSIIHSGTSSFHGANHQWAGSEERELVHGDMSVFFVKVWPVGDRWNSKRVMYCDYWLGHFNESSLTIPEMASIVPLKVPYVTFYMY